jgi:hypothetical protein
VLLVLLVLQAAPLLVQQAADLMRLTWLLW